MPLTNHSSFFSGGSQLLSTTKPCALLRILLENNIEYATERKLSHSLPKVGPGGQDLCCILSCIWTRLHLTCIRRGPLSTRSQYRSSYFVKFSQRKCRQDECIPTRRPSASSGSNTSTIGSALLVSRDDNDREIAEIRKVGDRGEFKSKSRNSGWFVPCTRRGYVARLTSPPLLEHEVVHFYPMPRNIPPRQAN